MLVLWLLFCVTGAFQGHSERHYPQKLCALSASSRGRPSPSNDKRRRKDHVDSLVSDIGLTIADTITTANKHNKKKRNKSQHHRPKSSTKNNISLETQLKYARNGHAVLRSCLDPSLLRRVRKEVVAQVSQQTLQAWQQKVEVASNSPSLAQSCHTIQECQQELQRLGVPWDSLPFLQFFNTWRTVKSVKQLAFDLGEAASILMDVSTVRLYQDSIFWKRANDGPTPWHVDARMAPFDTTNMITFWISLEPTTTSSLVFCSKSHADFALPFWNNFETSREYKRLEERYGYSAVLDYNPIHLGDVTAHSGWTLHCANAGHAEHDRVALAITFVDAKAEIRQDATRQENNGATGNYGDNEDKWSYMEWVQDVEPRRKFQHKLVPIVWPRNDTKEN